MSIYLRNGTYYADVEAEGFPRVRKSLNTRDKREATTLERELRRSIGAGEYNFAATKTPTSASYTLEEAFDRALRTVWADSKSVHSVLTNIGIIYEFFPKSTKLSSITTPRIAEFTEWLQGRYKAGATINRKLSTLQRVLNVAHKRWEVIDKAPTFGKVKEAEGRIRTLSFEDEAKMFDSAAVQADPLFRDLLVLLIETGCRLSEALRLTDRDYDKGLIRFWETKSGKARAVPLSSLAEAALERQRGYIRPFSRLGTIFQVEHRWRRVRKELAEDASYVPHTLRHTFATRMIEAGVDIFTVSKWLGHENVKTTERYAKVNPMHLRASMAKFEALRVAKGVTLACDVNREQRA